MIFLWIITQLLTRFAIDFSPNEVMNTDGMNVTFVLPHWQDYTLSLTQVNKRWLATVFIKKIALDEESYQNLILAVDLHRKKYAMNSKKDLKKFFFHDLKHQSYRKLAWSGCGSRWRSGWIHLKPD